MPIRPLLRSWTLLLALAVVVLVGSVGFAGYGLSTLPGGEGLGPVMWLAVMALLFVAGLGVVTFLVSLPIAFEFRRGGPSKRVPALALVVVSGFSVVFLPLLLASLLLCGLAVYEDHAVATCT